MRILSALRNAWIWLSGWWHHDLKVVDIQGDEVPSDIGAKSLVRMVDEGQAWAAAMRCPCGCEEVIELSLSQSANPRWDLLGTRRRPTLRPSVWRNVGCRSHFWVRDGRVLWVRNNSGHGP